MAMVVSTFLLFFLFSFIDIFLFLFHPSLSLRAFSPFFIFFSGLMRQDLSFFPRTFSLSPTHSLSLSPTHSLSLPLSPFLGHLQSVATKNPFSPSILLSLSFSSFYSTSTILSLTHTQRETHFHFLPSFSIPNQLSLSSSLSPRNTLRISLSLSFFSPQKKGRKKTRSTRALSLSPSFCCGVV